MLFQKQSAAILALLIFLTTSLVAAPGAADLAEYVTKPETQFDWKLKDTTENEKSGDRTYYLHLISQTWQGIPWVHEIQVHRPGRVASNSTVFLWVTGGSPRPAHGYLAMELARKIGAPVAFLYQIPNQPLLEGNLREDDLIAETFVRYLKTKDESWPLLFPMVKSVVKAMDVLQAFGEKEWGAPPEGFIVAGASKRGWTTWLTAAVDKRVQAIAPVVIDTLNMRAQMPKQLEVFGAYSSRLAPYTSRGLLPIPETAEGQRLLDMVDPWAYRDRLKLPKLIINGSNDFYWATDALNLYWNELPEKKWVLYVPNAGHDLLRQDRADLDQLTYLVNGLAAFSRHQIRGTSMPNLTWKEERLDKRIRLTIESSPPPTSAKLWTAEARTRDFRAAKWKEQPLNLFQDWITGLVTRPADGHVAFFGELEYATDGLKYRLSTQVYVTE